MYLPTSSVFFGEGDTAHDPWWSKTYIRPAQHYRTRTAMEVKKKTEPSTNNAVLNVYFTPYISNDEEIVGIESSSAIKYEI